MSVLLSLTRKSLSIGLQNNWFYFVEYDRRGKLSPEKECTSFGRERSGALFFLVK